jgi:2-polyprenyl-6-methoxyphenol hydroxylase-like FAD-dependent oxidoreductase
MVDRLKNWHRPGLVCLGDAAHAMSPVGGVGINLAIQDAVAAANLLSHAIREGRDLDEVIGRVQQQREFPTRWTQRFQLQIHRRVLERALDSSTPVRMPWYLRLLLAIPAVRRIPARIVGVGIRPEHVETRDALATSGDRR